MAQQVVPGHGDPLVLLRAAVARKRDELARLERAVACLTGLEGVDTETVSGRTPRAKRVGKAPVPSPDAGLQAEVLGALRALRRPAKWREVAAKLPKIKRERVLLTLRALAARKEIVKTGATLSLRYAAPEFVADASE